MKKKEGQRILQQLAQQSDVMIENYVPGESFLTLDIVIGT